MVAMSDAVLRLVLLRHATAEPDGGRGDEARPLTEEGLDEAARLGHWLRDNDLLGEAVVCSPAARTRETWAAIQEATGHGVLIEMEPAIYEADVDTLVRVVRDLAATHPEARTAVIVGHAPGIPALAHELSGGVGEPRMVETVTRGFVPASAAVIALEGEWSDVDRGRGEIVAARSGGE